MGHLAIFTTMQGFKHRIATTVLKISKSIAYAPKNAKLILQMTGMNI